MVIAAFCPGVNVEIIVDGQPLLEYDDDAAALSPPNTVTKYIEARSEAEFAVKVTIMDNFLFPPGDIEVKITLDRDHSYHGAIPSNNLFKEGGNIVRGRSAAISPWTDAIQNFRFTALNITESDGSLVRASTTNKLDAIGEIAVQIQFIRNLSRTVGGNDPVYEEHLGQVPEEALKGDPKSHQARLGPPIHTQLLWRDCDWLHPLSPHRRSVSSCSLLVVIVQLNLIATVPHCIATQHHIASRHNKHISMAVLAAHPGLDVAVVVNGEPLREHVDPNVENQPDLSIKYIEAKADDTFETLINFLPEFTATYGMRTEVRLDGNKVSSCLLRLSELKKPEGHKTSGVSSKIGGRWHMSNFVFSPFAVELDSARKLDEATSERLGKAGTITVLLHRVKNLRWARRNRAPVVQGPANIPHRVSKFGSMPEKSLQALGLSHYGGVSAPQQKRTGKSFAYDSVDGEEDEHAFATFHFKYRSLETLKALLIVPRTPELTPSPSATKPALSSGQRAPSHDGVEDGLSSEELIAVITTYRGHSAGLHSLSQKELMAVLEHHRSPNTPVRGIKREHDGDVQMGSCEKRKKPEHIVLDD